MINFILNSPNGWCCHLLFSCELWVTVIELADKYSPWMRDRDEGCSTWSWLIPQHGWCWYDRSSSSELVVGKLLIQVVARQLLGMGGSIDIACATMIWANYHDYLTLLFKIGAVDFSSWVDSLKSWFYELLRVEVHRKKKTMCGVGKVLRLPSTTTHQSQHTHHINHAALYPHQ